MTAIIALTESTLGAGAPLALAQTVAIAFGAGFVVLAAILILERLEL